MFDQERLRNYGQRIVPLILVLWLVALIPAARKLIRFEWTAGSVGVTPTSLHGGIGPSIVKNPNISDDHTGLLVVAIHPLCSCTRATLKELEDSVATWKQPYHATMLIYKAKPQANLNVTDFDWRRASYIRDAQQALHADVIEDEGGEQAARLGALTSGEVLYYSAPDKNGLRNLLFSGGVTAGRGMEGENDSIDALERAVQSTSGRQTAEAHTPVFGCGLAASTNSSSGGLSK